MAGTPAGAAELTPFAQVVGGTVTGPQWHADTVREAHAHAMNALAADVPPGSVEAIRGYEAEMEQALVALAERADTLERERDDMARLLIDMGEALSSWCALFPKGVDPRDTALLARLDALGEDTA